MVEDKSLNEEYYAYHYNGTNHVVQSTLLFQCE